MFLQRDCVMHGGGDGGVGGASMHPTRPACLSPYLRLPFPGSLAPCVAQNGADFVRPFRTTTNSLILWSAHGENSSCMCSRLSQTWSAHEVEMSVLEGRKIAYKSSAAASGRAEAALLTRQQVSCCLLALHSADTTRNLSPHCSLQGKRSRHICTHTYKHT